MCLYNYKSATRTHYFTYNYYKIYSILFIFICMSVCEIDAFDSSFGTGQIKTARGLFSPRMQYDEWTPLGRGDPLKNDPTFDYVPPVLERVHYWVPPDARTPDPPRSSSTTTTVLPASRPQVSVIQDRIQDLGVTRIRQQYIPVYYQYRPNHHHQPYTILVPPPPGKPHQYTPAPSIAVAPTTTTISTNDFWETQLPTVAPATKSQYNRQPSLNVTPAPSVLHFLLHSELASTLPPSTKIKPSTITTTVTTTASNPSLTTDPLFSHYKQPIEPLRGPMYLIIQGHSKVKTYGPAKLDKISGIPVQETNEVSENEDFQKHQNSR
ncbi:uncharacterized protein LOC142327008 [Lycorma delicatula]|uniref:uncharacterized protein LOC142327008 n=1 Tax=Lycorma delicatula TaxID=130591 RepID=UPI003F50F1CB